MFYPQRKKRKRGTYMKLASVERLRSFVLTRDDMDLINSGRGHLVNKRKISQRLLADRVGVNPSFINHLTAGRSTTCTPQVADRIAEALGVDTSVLFDEVTPRITRTKVNQHAKSPALA